MGVWAGVRAGVWSQRGLSHAQMEGLAGGEAGKRRCRTVHWPWRCCRARFLSPFWDPTFHKGHKGCDPLLRRMDTGHVCSCVPISKQWLTRDPMPRRLSFLLPTSLKPSLRPRPKSASSRKSALMICPPSPVHTRWLPHSGGVPWGSAEEGREGSCPRRPQAHIPGWCGRSHDSAQGSQRSLPPSPPPVPCFLWFSLSPSPRAPSRGLTMASSCLCSLLPSVQPHTGPCLSLAGLPLTLSAA